MSVSGITLGAATYSYRISVYSISISASQGATSAPSESTNPAATPPVSSDQFKHDLTTLFQAVKSGDLTAAREALQEVQKDRPELFTSGVMATGSKAALQADFLSLVDAVQSGNATSAQDALAKLQSDVHVGHAHHRHRHHGNESASPAAGSPASGGSPASSDRTAADGAPASSGDRDGDGDGH